MKIFGTVFPFVESDDSSLKLGRFVANYEFLKALLTHATFDEYHLFCMSTSHFNKTTKRLLEEDIPKEKKARVKLYLFNHLIPMVKENEYAVFHLGGWGYFFPGLAYIRNNHAKNQFPITGIIHSLNGIETNFHSYKILHAPLQQFDSIVCTSSAGKKVLEKSFSQLTNNSNLEYGGRFDIIPLGTDKSFTQLPTKKECRQKLAIDENKIIVLTVGRISPKTKYDPYPIIIAIADIIKENADKAIELIIAGGASEAERRVVEDIIKEESVEKSVSIVSNFTDDNKKLLYGASDIYISLSDNLQETFGLSVIEAMAASLPVIVSDINGYKELVEENSSGFKIPVSWSGDFEMNELSSIMNFETLQLMLSQCMAVDIEIFKERVQKLISTPDLRESMGKSGQSRASENYIWAKVIEKYEKLWGELFELSKNSIKKSNFKKDIFANDYLESFSHYPTKTLENSDEIKLTNRGLTALKTQKLPIPYNDIQPLLDNKTILLTLASLKKSSLKFSELSKIVPSLNQFTTLWMVKYNLLQIIV